MLSCSDEHDVVILFKFINDVASLSKFASDIFFLARFTQCSHSAMVFVLDKRSRDREVVVVRHTINLGVGILEWGGSGEGLRKGRSVYE